MNLDAFDYFLPDSKIAQNPKKNRSSSKLLLINRKTHELKDEIFSNIHNYFSSKDLLVVNDTKVIPARIFGYRKHTNGKVEIFIERIISKNKFICQIQSTRKIKNENIIVINNEIELKILDNNSITCEVEILNSNINDLLENYGEIPLPPYINRQATKKDKFYYQTIFAKKEGSVASPTAALHFDKKTLENLKNKNINIASITLHIGMGTFSSIKKKNIDSHKMHPEIYCVPQKTVNLINSHKKNGGNIIAVGTTTARALESFYSKKHLADKVYETDIFIKPGYKFKIIDNLITNFHLPKSTLLIMVSAFYDREKILNAYNHALKNNYKFFSYGDSTLIL